MGELRKLLRVPLAMLLAVGMMIPCSVAIAQTKTAPSQALNRHSLEAHPATHVDSKSHP